MEDSYSMKAWDERGLIEDAAARAVDDWLHVADFVSIARRTEVTTQDALRALAMGLIVEALIRELLVPGDVDDLGFHPWVGTTGEAIVRIAESWDEEELSPTPGSVAWFALTPVGKDLGARVLERER